MLNKREFIPKELRQVFKNFGYLSILQLFGIMGPIVVFPFLISKLGKENYGLLVLAQATISFFVVFVNFGFNITATQEISQNRTNKKKIDKIVSSVYILKFILLFISLIILSCILPYIPQANNNYLLFYFSLYLCLNDFAVPIWYFQGIEQMKYITFLNAFSKTISLVLILFLIKNPDDYLKVPIIYLCSCLLMGFTSVYIIFFNHGVTFISVNFITLKHTAKSSFFVFLSKASFILMESSSKIIINTFFGLSDLAIYDFLLRILEAARKPFSLLSQAFFPSLSASKNMYLSKKILLYTTVAGICIYIGLLIFSDVFVLYFLEESDKTLFFKGILILGICIPLSCLTWGLGENTLIVMGYLKEYNWSTIFQVLIYYISATFLYVLFHKLSFEMILLLYIIPIFFEVIFRFYFVNKYEIFRTNKIK